MARTRRDQPRELERTVLLATGDAQRRRELKEALARGGARGRAPAPRLRVVTAATAAEALRRAGASSAAAVDLAIPGGAGLETIRQLREAHPELAILAFGASTAPSDAIASVMAGADFFHDCAEGSAAGFVRAVELALDRRRLAHTIAKSEAEVEAARGRLAQLSGELVQAVPGFRPLRAREEVLPFREAARRYLLGAAQLFAGDPRGLARALGVSYFALRRLLARYEVPVPTIRPRR
jgi:DNA-binding NarL/FixJ family response regulator